VPELLAAARHLTRNEHDARDVVQSTVELGLRHFKDLRDPDRLRPWLFAIEAHEASRWRRRFRDALPLGTTDVAQPGTERDPRSIALRVAIDALPRQQRLAVVLHHLVGLSVDESAAAMHVTGNTIKTHLRLGLQALREALND
jgi:RNA polymerase sigma-70 factor (ECF subfamily)